MKVRSRAVTCWAFLEASSDPQATVEAGETSTSEPAKSLVLTFHPSPFVQASMFMQLPFLPGKNLFHSQSLPASCILSQKFLWGRSPAFLFQKIWHQLLFPVFQTDVSSVESAIVKNSIFLFLVGENMKSRTISMGRNCCHLPFLKVRPQWWLLLDRHKMSYVYLTEKVLVLKQVLWTLRLIMGTLSPKEQHQD